MKTETTINRFVERADAVIPKETLDKATAEEYTFARISSGYFTCTHGDTTHIIGAPGNIVGCSCGSMTFHCKGKDVCKHIAAFLNLATPPQGTADTDTMLVLMETGWTGGKGNLHPPETTSDADGDDAEDDIVPDDVTPPAPPTPPEKKEYSNTCEICGVTISDTDESRLRYRTSQHRDICQAPVKESLTAQVKTTAPLVPDLYTVQHHHPQKPPPNDEDVTPASVPTHTLAAAICAMQGAGLEALTDSDNPFHNSKYADLSSVWNVIREPLTSNGLAIVQTTEPYEDGVTVVTTLMHVSGESITTRLSSKIPQSKPDKNGQVKPNIQGLGSTITYLRRYSLSSLVGVCPVDDDGESAMGRT